MEELTQRKQPTPQTEPSGTKRSCGGCVVRLLLFGLLLTVVCTVAGAAFYYRTLSKLTSSPPYKQALEQIQASPEAIEALDEPIEVVFSWLPSGRVFEENGSGEASFDFDVTGPKGQAHIHSESRLFDGQWSLTVLEMTPADGPRVSIKLADDEGLPDAPKWSPAAVEATETLDGPSLPEGFDVTLPPVLR